MYSDMGTGCFKAFTFSDYSKDEDIKSVAQKMFTKLETGTCYRVKMAPLAGGTTSDAYVYCANSLFGIIHLQNHENANYYGRLYNGTWTWDSYALKSDLSRVASYNSWADNLDTPSNVIIARTPADPTGYPSNLGGNSCLVLQLNPGEKYSAQLAFGFSKDRLAIRRKSGSDTWTSWKYVDFTIS